MRVRFLGSGDAFGSGGRLQTCILLESGDFRCLVDCGASSLIALKRAAIDPNDIDTILITHLHGDHFGGIPFLVLDGQFSHRSRRLLVAGPPGVAERVTKRWRFFSQAPREHSASSKQNSWNCRRRPSDDRGLARYALRGRAWQWGSPVRASNRARGFTIGYSGETEWTDNLIPAAAGSDLFISEAYFYGKPIRFHLDYATLAHHRSQLGCKRLIVTHMGPDMLAHVAGLPVEAAYDGMEISL